MLRGVLRGVPFLSLEVSEVFRFRIWRCPEVCFFEFGSVRGARSRVWRCPRCASRCPFSSLEVSEVPVLEFGGVLGAPSRDLIILLSHSGPLPGARGWARVEF